MVPTEVLTAAPPSPVAEPTVTPTPADTIQTSFIEVRIITPTPVDIASIPNFDRPADPTPRSASEERSRCLSYTVQPEPSGQSRRLRVRVRNACTFWVPPEQSWFEIVATPSNGQGTTGKATGSFQGPIAPHSSNVETFIEVDCPSEVQGGCRYTVTPQ